MAGKEQTEEDENKYVTRKIVDLIVAMVGTEPIDELAKEEKKVEKKDKPSSLT